MNYIEEYNALMKESTLRANAVKELLIRIKKRCITHEFSDEVLGQIGEIMVGYEVEEGVSIFFPTGNPREKREIGKVDLGKEYLCLWWGLNLNKKKRSYPNAYALGITFKKYC